MGVKGMSLTSNKQTRSPRSHRGSGLEGTVSSGNLGTRQALGVSAGGGRRLPEIALATPYICEIDYYYYKRNEGDWCFVWQSLVSRS
jgi:hypothetical protein